MMTSKWQHFKALSFLKEIVRPRQTSGNCSAIADLEATEDANLHALEEYGEEVVPSKGDNEADHVENNANENVTEGTSDHATTDPPASTEVEQVGTQNVRRFNKHTVNRIKRKRSEDYQSSILEIERKKLEILSQKKSGKGETEAEDEHLMFLKTLLPHVKKIRPEQIFPFRSRIQDVHQFAYPVSYCRVCNTSKHNYNLSHQHFSTKHIC